MRRTTWLLALVFAGASSAAIYSQAPATGDRSWAFPLKVERPFPEDDTQKSAPGSTRKYTMKQIDDLLNPPDWYPEKHPAAPEVVTKGMGDRMACGACHLMSGLGHPESSDLTGLSADYIVQQMADFRSGARKDPTRMNGIAKATTPEQDKQAAAYFASLPRQKFNRVVEQATVPKTFLGNGRMRFVESGGATEPIGLRIITVPEDQDRARLRDPYSGFVSYVPPGSLAKGKELVETGGGKTVGCEACHGQGQKGNDNIPRLAGMHPIYTVRQLHWFKDGSRNGDAAGLMKGVVEQLTDEDIVNISAYLASLEP